MTAEEWNARYPVGTPVRYWSGVMEGPGVESVTRSEAWYCSGAPVVAVKGKAGGISLTHIRLAAAPATEGGHDDAR